MLVLKNISRAYPQRGVVLNNLSHEVAESETLAIVGPSGSGKTTLLNIIGLLDRPDSGDVFYKDNKVTELDQEEAAAFRRDNIGFVFQEHLLLPYLSIRENIELPLLALGKKGWDQAERKDYIGELMTRCGIQDLGDKMPGQVSGGEAQRATLVRALVNRPSLLLADEPTGSLDNRNASILADLFADLNDRFKTTIIMVTHSTELAGRMQKIFELKNGVLVPSK